MNAIEIKAGDKYKIDSHLGGIFVVTAICRAGDNFIFARYEKDNPTWPFLNYSIPVADIGIKVVPYKGGLSCSK